MPRFRHIVYTTRPDTGAQIVRRVLVHATRCAEDPPAVGLPDGGIARGKAGDWLVVEEGRTQFVPHHEFVEHFEPIAGDTQSLAVWRAATR